MYANIKINEEDMWIGQQEVIKQISPPCTIVHTFENIHLSKKLFATNRQKAENYVNTSNLIIKSIIMSKMVL